MLVRSAVSVARGVSNRAGVTSRGMANRGWMNGNAQLDELAGRRETTYKDWEWNNKTLGEVSFGFILPIVVFGSMIVAGFRERRERMGRGPVAAK